MHRTIVQNKIISIIYSYLFLYLANIYRPSLGKVQLGKPNPNQYKSLNFCLRRGKKIFYSELYALQHLRSDFQFSFSFIFKKLFLKNASKNLSKCLTIYIIIINYYFLNQTAVKEPGFS